MTHALTELAAVLEEETRVGEELLHNLAAQREAILSWNSSALLERVEEKERLVRRLGAMEERRQEIMAHFPCARVEKKLSLRELLAQLPLGSEAAALSHLEHRAQEVYSRLRAEEKRLVSLMENLLGHLREALSPLSHPPVRLYGKRGTPAHPRPESGLIQGKV